MRVRIDLKIFIFLFLFYLTHQLRIYLIIMFFCFLHELGHIIVGLILKMKLEKIEIMPLGFSASFFIKELDLDSKILKGDMLELKKIIVALAGPIINALAIMFFININIFTFELRQEVIYSNILILIFNLLPLYPLDGGRILKGILHIEFGKVQSKKLIIRISEISMIIITIISSIAVYYFENIGIFLACLFLWWITLVEKNKKSLDISE